MSLVKLYDALIEANVSNEKATAAVEAVEGTLDTPWKEKTDGRLNAIESRLAALEAELRVFRWAVIGMFTFHISLTAGILAHLLVMAS